MRFLNTVNDYLWGYVVIFLLIGAALYFTVRSKGAQFRLIADAIRIMMGRDKNPGTKDQKKIGSFQAFAVSLASRVGTGNLAGVASAIFVGGPGAVFWMWLMAMLGGATAFVEATLAQLYKCRGKDSFYGGPAYYMEKGLGKRWVGIIFSIFLMASFGLANQIVQSTTIIDSLNDTLGWDKMTLGIVLALGTFTVIAGGILSISRTVSLIVPFMALGFILIALIVIILNAGELPGIFGMIFDNAFGAQQVGGGVAGAAIQQGIKRGLFSNEAGEGSAPNAAAIAATSHPVKQGAVQALGVFIDTLVICTCTAFIILLSPEAFSGADGIILTTRCLESEIGSIGRYFITAAIFLFAFSTIIANYYYGETSIRHITNSTLAIWAFRVMTSIVIILGAVLTLQEAWSIIDIVMGLLTIINVVSILLLSGKVFRLLGDYMEQKRQGLKDPVFDKSKVFPELADKLEGWD